MSQLCELSSSVPSTTARPQQAEAPRAPRKPVTPLAEQLLRLLVLSPGLAHTLSAEHRALLDLPEMAPVLELIEAVLESGATSPAMLFEATRESQYSGSYQDIAARSLADAVDDEIARAILSDVLLKLEKQRMESEFERLSAGGVRSDVERQRFQEVTRRLAELKKATTGSRAEI